VKDENTSVSRSKSFMYDVFEAPKLPELIDQETGYQQI
jgi:hypothetical protein